MSTQDDEFLDALRGAFRVEASEHLDALSKGLLELEREAAPAHRAELLEGICREAHSLKGASRAVGRTDIEGLCQALESVLVAWKRGEASPSAAAFDAAHEALDAVRTLAAAADAGDPARHDGLRQRLGAGALAGGAPPAPPAGPAAPSGATPEPAGQPVPVSTAEERDQAMETVRLPTARLERLLLKLEELLATKSAVRSHARELGEILAGFERWQREYVKAAPAVRVLRSPDSMEGASSRAGAHAVAEFLTWQQALIKSLEASLRVVHRSAMRETHATERLVDDLLGDAKGLLMFPMATLLSPFPRVVRDLCRAEGKDAEVRIEGAQIEIDKRVLQELKDPLMHLVRNSVDHGIETVDVRRSRNKPARGAITIAVAPLEGRKVEIRVSDDGAGIDADEVRAAAVRQKAIDAETASRLTRDEAINLVFRSDVSTRRAVTTISGRGLGLAIVRERAERLGGHVRLETRLGEGTVFTLVVPLTLATFRGLLVGAGGMQFIVPAAHVERVGRVPVSSIRRSGRRDVVDFGPRALLLAHLDRVLDLPHSDRGVAGDRLRPVIVLNAGERHAAFAVDEILTEEEVLVKPLTRPLVRVRHIAGVTVLGSGQAVPVLNAADLVASAIASQAGRERPPSRREGAGKRILVVEDSITSRMLIKGLLESAGYSVKTAVDGAEALTCARSEDFDLVVSDVDMPRMNGFDLTAGIRSNPRTARLPVVLVTALSSPADRERGMAAGASAFVTKSSFDRSDLLNVLQKLV
jgi:two-component system chemotaxis sensor kinase CheA